MKTPLILLGAFALASCGTTRLPPIQHNKPAPVQNPTLAPTNLNHVEWKVRDLAGLKALVRDLEETGQTDVILYILPQDQYNVLAMNVSEIKRYIADQKVANDFLYSTIDINSKELPVEKK